MRPPRLALLLLLLAPMVQADGGLPYTFTTPAQWTGTLETTGLDWALIVMGPDHEGTMDLATTGVQWIGNHTSTKASSHSDLAGTYYTRHLPPSEYVKRSDDAGKIGFAGNGWKSLYVEAQELKLSLAGIGSLTPLQEAAAVETGLRNNNQPSGTIHQGYHRIGDRTVGVAGEKVAWLTLEASGLRVVEWHNGSVGCMQGSCWPASDSQGFGSNGQSLRVLRYTEVKPENGTVIFQGAAWSFASGGREVDLALQGNLRLPGLQRATTCEDCMPITGQTLTLQGDSRLEKLQWHSAEGNQFSSHITAAGGRALLDEAEVASELISGVGVAATAVAGIGLTILAVKALLPLFTRIHKPEALENPRRRQVLDEVTNNPGFSFSGLVRATGLATGTVRHHLTVLKRLGFIQSATRGNTIRFYPVGIERSRRDALAVLQDPACRELCVKVAERPGIIQKELMDAFAPSMPRSTVQFKLIQLRTAEVLLATRVGRRLIYQPGKHFPAMLLTAPDVQAAVLSQ